MSLETGFLYLCKNILCAHSLMKSMTLHVGRTGFPVCLFPNESKHFLSLLQKFLARKCHSGQQLEKHPFLIGDCPPAG